MATPEVIAEPHVQRRRHFATWVRKLTNFKSSSEADRNKGQEKKTRRGTKLNNPYPQSGSVGCGYYNGESSYSFTAAPSQGASSLSFDPSERGRWSSEDHHPPRTAGRGSSSIAWTAEGQAARQSIAPSHGASSLAGTSRTIGTVGGQGSRRGGDSTFSSPAPSVRSLATTLTTIQSSIAQPHGNGNGQGNGHGNGQGNGNGHGNGQGQHGNGYGHGQHGQHGHGHAVPSSLHSINNSNTQSIHFTQPFPNMATVSALPAHLAPPSHPTTYTTATANNLLTDDASILTLASSSKRRRRRSMDTDASVRALAPSSVWGGSRESLPLSVLSASIDPSASASQHAHSNPRLAAERSSIYSATGVVGVLPPAAAAPGERAGAGSSYPRGGDGGSVRSGLLGHGRPDSVSGSVALASPREVSDEGSGDDD